MTDALAKQIAAIEDGLRLKQWPGHASAVITTLITALRQQDAELSQLRIEVKNLSRGAA